MRRFRYIWGGEEGRVAKGSDGSNGVRVPGLEGRFSEVKDVEDDLETMAGTVVPGGGAPLTI